MARYIDLDKLLKGLEDELKDKNHNEIAFLVFKLFIERLRHEPTADVVPRAEVEKVKQAYANYEETTGLKQAKTEAIKEFAVRLNEKLFSIPTVYKSHFARMIDNTIKEMTEGER